MRQAILLEPSDFAALRTGTPLTLQVGGVEVLLMTRSVSRDSAKRKPAPTNGNRRTYTDAQRRSILKKYDAVQYKGAWLERNHYSSGMIFAWKRRFKAGGR